MELRSYPFHAMGCPCDIRLYHGARCDADAAAVAAIDEVRRLEAKYSRYRDDSLATAINATAGDPAGIEVDDECAGLLDYADIAYRESDGLFDITSGILRRAWDFRSGRVPNRLEVAGLLSKVGWERVRWNSPHLALPVAGMELDFGGFVKEYASDRVAEICRQRGAAHGIIDLGGDLCVVGPHPNGTPWQIGIRDPRKPEEAIAGIPVTQGAVATSGDYERAMVIDGVRYGHILNPRNGWPVSSFASVSVIAGHCLIAGTASTIAMLKGPALGAPWLDALGLPHLRVAWDGEMSGTLNTPDTRAA